MDALDKLENIHARAQAHQDGPFSAFYLLSSALALLLFCSSSQAHAASAAWNIAVKSEAAAKAPIGCTKCPTGQPFRTSRGAKSLNLHHTGGVAHLK